MPVQESPVQLIAKLPASFRVPPILSDYERVRASFTWDAARRELDGLPGGAGLNIAHEAATRHARGPRRLGSGAVSATGKEQKMVIPSWRVWRVRLMLHSVALLSILPTAIPAVPAHAQTKACATKTCPSTSEEARFKLAFDQTVSLEANTSFFDYSQNCGKSVFKYLPR